MPLSVNQSKLLFYESDYISNLQALVERYRVPAGLITLEILEGLAADNMVDLNAKIQQLHELGFRVSMDDFGSGYSSLNTLYQLNIDELKLDQGFLLKSAYGAGTRRRVILEHIVQLAQRLSISTVVEGVGDARKCRLDARTGLRLRAGLPLQQAHQRRGIRRAIHAPALPRALVRRHSLSPRGIKSTFFQYNKRALRLQCPQTVKKTFREVWRAESPSNVIRIRRHMRRIRKLAQQGFLAVFPAREAQRAERETP